MIRGGACIDPEPEAAAPNVSATATCLGHARPLRPIPTSLVGFRPAGSGFRRMLKPEAEVPSESPPQPDSESDSESGSGSEGPARLRPGLGHCPETAGNLLNRALPPFRARFRYADGSKGISVLQKEQLH